MAKKAMPMKPMKKGEHMMGGMAMDDKAMKRGMSLKGGKKGKC